MTEANPYEGLYKDCTISELQHLRQKFLGQLTEPETFSWKALYYVGGLLAAMGAAYLIFLHGVDTLSAVLLAVGLPAVWLWLKDDKQRRSADHAYKAVVAELARRGQS